MDKSSKIFTPYRSLGLVTNHVPINIRYIKKRHENFIVTVIGNSFHTYEENKLRLLQVSNAHSKSITCLSGDTYHIYTSDSNEIFAWRRSIELVHKYGPHLGDVKIILPFGRHLLSVDTQNFLYIWTIKSEELFLKIEFLNTFKISTVLHPATYLNKIILGSEQGKLQLWNINTNKLIYTFNGWDSEVKILKQAPAKHIIAIGLSTGDIYLHNLKKDKVVIHFKQDWGPVTSISFRTDGVHVMVSGSSLGHIAIWDLNERRVISQLWQAHHGPVTGLECLMHEPRMVTSSSDNNLKIWIFDMPDGGARLQNYRDGHSAPPLMARFHGSLGDTILTAGEDATIRQFSTATDHVNKNLGQASYNRKAAKRSKKNREKLKMPAVVAIASEAMQEKPWDNIACIHRNVTAVSTWSFEEQKMGDKKLLHKRFKNGKYSDAIATCLELSACGNFILIAYDSGHLDKYNIQSGIYKGSFLDSTKAHEETISGIVSDSLNQVAVSSDHQGIVKWWKFKLQKKISQIEFKYGVTLLKLHRESGLLIIALEDWSLHISDIDTRTIIRKLIGHTNQITDAVFSVDSKWVISSSLDKSIRTWDLPSSSTIDIFNVPVAVNSIAMSPTNDFLATIHAGHLGVYLWANRSCFRHVSLTPLPSNYIPPLIQLPSIGADEISVPQRKTDEVMSENEEMEVDEILYESPDQIAEELISLALLPTSRWLNLLHIDTIKKRNKPIEPPKVPKSAPFFIPTVPGLEFKFQENVSENRDNSSKLMSVPSFEILTAFGQVLKDTKYEEALEMLMKMGPSAIDVEIRSLHPDAGGSEVLLLTFLNMIKHFIAKKKNFEVVQGYLGLFLKVHSEFLIQNEKANKICEKMLIFNSDCWLTLKNNINQSLSLISYLKNAAIINY